MVDLSKFKGTETSKKKHKPGLFCKDVEIPVPSGKDALELLTCIGFTDITHFQKQRISYRHKDIEISIDHVKDLGTFFEFEIKKRQYDNAEQEYQRLLDYLYHTIGITDYTLQKQGFIILLWNPEFDFCQD